MFFKQKKFAVPKYLLFLVHIALKIMSGKFKKYIFGYFPNLLCLKNFSQIIRQGIYSIDYVFALAASYDLTAILKLTRLEQILSIIPERLYF